MEKSNHQQYKDLIFSIHNLSLEDERDKRLHLEECIECRILNKSVEDIENMMQKAPVMAARIGFNRSVRLKIQNYHERREKRLGLTTLAILSGISLVLMIFLGIRIYPIIASPKPFILNYVAFWLSMILQAGKATDIIVTVMTTLIDLIPEIVWTGTFIFSGLLIFFWISIYNKIYRFRRIVI